MLFLLFQLGRDRYALEVSRVVEVLPLLELKRLPQAPKGVAGVFNYRGRPVPAVDLSELTLGQPASERMSTRIIVVSYRGSSGASHLLGLVAENATEILRKDPKDFVDSGVRIGAAPYLGPVLMDAEGRPIQWLHEQHLLSEPIENLLFRQPVLLQEVNRLPPASREGELQEGAKHETMSRNAPDRTIGIDG
jgi:chemotaxis-related protein WspB